MTVDPDQRYRKKYRGGVASWTSLDNDIIVIIIIIITTTTTTITTIIIIIYSSQPSKSDKD
jgi:hypothetical protein